MEELFEGVIALIVIIASLAKFMGQTKKVKQNAPGQAAEPAKPTATARPAVRPAENVRPVPAAPTVKPTVQPSRGAELPDFWKQVSEAIKEELSSGNSAPVQPAKGHEAAGRMPEGDSRECEHGSVGGSMAYTAHQEGGEKLQTRPAAAAPGQRKPVNEQAYRPAMNAQEMRRAVVMAEILKRPQERMAEQARRWSIR